MAKFYKETFINYDDYMTPKSVWEDIKDFIPKDAVIWEAFYGNGESGEYLKELGFNVIHQNIDFFDNNLGDIIVSNPPFSKLKEILIRLEELDKPFILIMPSSKINTQYFRRWKDKNIQIIIPKKRINFDKIVNGKISDKKSQCNFDCFFYCYKIGLKKDIIFL
jgi:hypothetical protein